MPLSMFQASVPVFVRTLTNLLALLEKAEAHAENKKIDPSVFLNARLAPDMYPLTRQIQIATDGVKGCAARLAGMDVPKYEDNEASFAELKGRIAKTLEFIGSISPDKIDGSEDKDITLKIGSGEMSFKGQPFLLHFVLPNLFFHVTTTYAILRHNGVELGKMDYLGKPD